MRSRGPGPGPGPVASLNSSRGSQLTALLETLVARSAGGSVVPFGAALPPLPLALVSAEPAADDADVLVSTPGCEVAGALEDDSSGLTPSRWSRGEGRCVHRSTIVDQRHTRGRASCGLRVDTPRSFRREAPVYCMLYPC